MAGIYIHIPFCKQACHYCNFHFSTSMKHKNGFLDALLKEISLQAGYLEEHDVETIYFGGGTPSLLTGEELGSVLTAIYSRFNITPGAEITFETNPDDINLEKLMEWKSRGINRLSIGVQSFYDEDLRWMNRAHDAGQAQNSIAQSQSAGFENITIDLIYGTPGLTDQKWKNNVEQAISLGIPHLSCYALTVEPSTALEKMIALKKSPPVNTDDQARQFGILMDALGEAGYEHYEISNFALPGKRSRHNSSYWQRQPYLGLGPSAHSFKGNTRQWNVSNNILYINSLSNNEVPFEFEVLTPVQEMNEIIMTSLRTSEGLDLPALSDRFGSSAVAEVIKSARPYLDRNLVIEKDGHLMLSIEGKLFADGIAAALFFEECQVKT